MIHVQEWPGLAFNAVDPAVIPYFLCLYASTLGCNYGTSGNALETLPDVFDSLKLFSLRIPAGEQVGLITSGQDESTALGEVILREGFTMVGLDVQNCPVLIAQRDMWLPSSHCLTFPCTPAMFCTSSLTEGSIQVCFALSSPPDHILLVPQKSAHTWTCFPSLYYQTR